MESGVDFPSPESTVTSLLSSSGHLRSSLLAPEHNTTFRYRDKIYDSATAALDAYITDFERSCQISGSSTGSLVLPHSPPCTPSRPRASTLRNKDVLRERLTERELDFLNLPVSSLHHRGNRDRLSMTTDELLSIPYDGSMPVTHTSAFIHGLNSAHRATRSEWAEPSSSLHLPRWFTSNKSEMDCSGITSVPDLKYPAWVQRCDRSEPPPSSEAELWDDHGTTPSARHQHCQAPRTPAWVAELEDEVPDHKPKQGDSQQTLRELRLQFAEQISLLAAERNSSDIMETLFKDNRIESLIQKADQVLNSLSQSSGEADPGSPADYVEAALSPANTEELLLCSSSHCRPFTQYLATAAGGGITEALTDIKAQAQGSGLHRNSILKQPGPVEALKQMLFRLQAVEAEVQRQTQASVAPTFSDKDGLQAETTPEKQWPESEAELENVSGGPSLQRALHHLSRLKVLVEEREKKHTEKEEEKDEDEGRYSSSSAEGLPCTQQTPT
ncbi:lung adenoma susceptibility protein 2 [Etheostoma cragini]|uniref:lung adenoma susceptibility protein 2 n=1 Tax=Etheostoma cragini TaxID=417921 RepID=UPI00155F4AE8|nr:lung adenoma susceptibility protein 2 [Etheostoma cragini]